MILDDQRYSLITNRGVWEVAAKHSRPGGDADVILSFRAAGQSDKRFLAFRHGAYWQQLVGAWVHRYQAIPAAAREMDVQVLTHRALIPLLDLALALADFPDTPDPAGEA